MTQEQVAKAKELSVNIEHLRLCINMLNKGKPYELEDFEVRLLKYACYIAKDEVLPIFEKKLQELKNELAEL